MNNRIRLVRKTLHMSQRKFGEKLGVSRDVISNMEFDRVQPKPLLIQHICDLYGVSEQWMATGEGPMFQTGPKTNKNIDEALALFQSLRPEFQDCALEQIRLLVRLQGNCGSHAPESIGKKP